MPHYSGPDFTFENWTRRTGALAKLDLLPAPATTFAGPVIDANGTEPIPAGQPVKTLTNLRTYPLSALSVPGGNGWRPDGWHELHALAYDSVSDPYYLILYTHQTRGFVIDIKRAQTYVADFGQKVVFSQSPTTYGAAETVIGPPDSQFLRYTRQEIAFTATGTYTNPYNQIYLDVEFRAPDGKRLTIPGFWDGGKIWRARISPTVVGHWTWTTTSTDPGMNRQEGAFTCVSSPNEGKGFLSIDRTPGYKHHFATSDGTPFLPVFIVYPIHHLPDGGAPNKTAAVAAGAHLTTAANQAVPESYTRFQHDVDALAQLGFNRFIGEDLIDPAGFAAKTQRNEGGPPFLDYDPDHINPAYFQAMDQRLTYANDRGIVPDIGLGQLGSGILDLLTPDQVSRLWRYVIGRYAAYNVCWTPFDYGIGKPVPPEAVPLIESIQRTVLRNDPVHHPITMVLPGGVEVPRKPARAVTAGDSASPVAPQDNPEGGTAGYVNTAVPPPASGGFVTIPEDQTAASQAPGGAPGVSTPGTRQRGRGRRGAFAGDATAAPPSTSGTRATTSSGTRGAASKTKQSSKNARSSKKAATTRGTKSSKTRSAAAKGQPASGAGTRGTAPGAPGLSITPGAGNPGTPPGAPGRNVAPPPGSFPGGPPNGGQGGFPGGFPGGPPNGMANGFPNGFPGGAPGTLPGFGGPGGMQDPGAFFRGRNRGAGRTQEQNAVGSYIESPGGLQLGPTTTVVSRSTGPQVTVGPIPDWLDVITLNGGSIAAVSTVYNMNKPVVIYDQSAPSEPGGPRYRLWTTLMSGGYWAADAVGTNPVVTGPVVTSQETVSDSLPTRWAAYAGRLFAKTHFWRLIPHNDMLGGVEESAFERRRRRTAEAEAAKAAAAQDAAKGVDPEDDDSAGDGKPQVGPIYVLADPGWEYVVYFQRGGMLTLDLLEATGRVTYTWFNPRTGEVTSTDTVMGGAFRSFRAPDDNDWALFISRR